MKPVETVLLDRGAGNALDRAGLRRLLRRLRRLEHCTQVRVVILKSSRPSVFSSGLDLRSLVADGRLRTAWSVVSAVLLARRLTRRIMRSSKIYIAALRGGVIGSAVSLALACDFAYADKTAWFWLPDPVYGGLLADGGLDILRARCARTISQQLALSVERLDAVHALECGLIHAVEPADQLDGKIDDLAGRLVRLSRMTLNHTKRLLNRGSRSRPPMIPLIRAAISADMFRRTRGMLRDEGAVPSSREPEAHHRRTKTDQPEKHFQNDSREKSK